MRPTSPMPEMQVGQGSFFGPLSPCRAIHDLLITLRRYPQPAVSSQLARSRSRSRSRLPLQQASSQIAPQLGLQRSGRSAHPARLPPLTRRHRRIIRRRCSSRPPAAGLYAAA